MPWCRQASMANFLHSSKDPCSAFVKFALSEEIFRRLFKLHDIFSDVCGPYQYLCLFVKKIQRSRTDWKKSSSCRSFLSQGAVAVKVARGRSFSRLRLLRGGGARLTCVLAPCCPSSGNYWGTPFFKVFFLVRRRCARCSSCTRTACCTAT